VLSEKSFAVGLLAVLVACCHGLYRTLAGFGGKCLFPEYAETLWSQMLEASQAQSNETWLYVVE